MIIAAEVATAKGCYRVTAEVCVKYDLPADECTSYNGVQVLEIEWQPLDGAANLNNCDPASELGPLAHEEAERALLRAYFRVPVWARYKDELWARYGDLP